MGDKPAAKRAFYSIVSEDDNAPSVANLTESFVNSNNQVSTLAQLQVLDSNNDG